MSGTDEDKQMRAIDGKSCSSFLVVTMFFCLVILYIFFLEDNKRKYAEMNNLLKLKIVNPKLLILLFPSFLII